MILIEIKNEATSWRRILTEKQGNIFLGCSLFEEIAPWPFRMIFLGCKTTLKDVQVYFKET
jgi:hypothetical protein